MRPVLAIVGRPNVGKSTLLNRLAGRQVALVADEPGVTRDRLFVETNLGDRGVILVDTGGFDPDPGDAMSRLVVEHAQAAIDEADLVLFVCDGKDGLQPVDATVANLLRKSQKPVLCLVNKIDPGARDRQEYEFHQLGLDLQPVSAAHGSGLDSMIEWVVRKLPEPVEAETKGEVDLRLCLLGRPNVGKSSLANHLAGKNRQIVSQTPGTTRDAVDIYLEQNGVRCLLVDTPGVRRRGRIHQKLEHHSVLAAIRSLERADVAVVVLDGDQTFADQDARLLNLVDNRGTGLVVAVNKIDLLDKTQLDTCLSELSHGMRFVSYAPVLKMSAKTGKGVDQMVPKASMVHRGLSKRVSTGDLNRFIADSVERLQPPLVRGRRGKIYYVTQAEVRPPTFVASVNDPARIPEHYRRYLENRLRKTFPFDGVPLRWKFRKRGKEAGKKKGSRRKKR